MIDEFSEDQCCVDKFIGFGSEGGDGGGGSFWACLERLVFQFSFFCLGFRCQFYFLFLTFVNVFFVFLLKFRQVQFVVLGLDIRRREFDLITFWFRGFRVDFKERRGRFLDFRGFFLYLSIDGCFYSRYLFVFFFSYFGGGEGIFFVFFRVFRISIILGFQYYFSVRFVMGEFDFQTIFKFKFSFLRVFQRRYLRLIGFFMGRGLRGLEF